MVPASSRASPSRKFNCVPFRDGARNRVAENSKVKLAATIELYAYWNRLRGARSAPERNDVDPGAIRGVLADTFVLDFDPRRGFPFRIAGSRANALFLKELRGFSFLELWRGADRGRTRFDSSLCRRRGAGIPYRRRGRAAQPRRSGPRDHSLPLRHHGLTHARVLGGLAVHAAPGWMGLSGAGPIALTSLRALGQPTREPLKPQDGAPVDFSLREIPRRYKHLFVYSGDRPAT